MVRIAPVGLQYNPRTLWFDPAGIEAKKGDAVVVRTERGVEFGHMAEDITEVDEAAIKKLRSPLKPVLRLATEKDLEQAAEMEERGRAALPVFREMAAETNEDMHPVMVEYLLDGDKAIFYFSAEERVDFRELVRKLAAHFHVRVDMRQIGVRDEARMVGGLGHCGQELCCKRLGGEFCPVSIRMAKEQDLSLNPAKISGVCGRLMCCLRYEFEAYKDFKQRAPKAGATISTPDGPAKVTELNVPREIVSLKLEDGKIVKVPLEDFIPAEEGGRPTEVEEEAFERCKEPEIASGPSLVSFATPRFTGTDKLSDGTVRVSGRRGARKGEGERTRKDAAAKADTGRRQRRRKGSGGQADAAASEKSAPKQAQSHRSRRNRSTQVHTAEPQSQNAASAKQASKAKGGAPKQAAVRPGQHSSALREAPQRRKRRRSEDTSAQSAGQGARTKQPPRAEQGASADEGQRPSRQRSGKQPEQQAARTAHRTARRRSHRANTGSEAGGKPTSGSETS